MFLIKDKGFDEIEREIEEALERNDIINIKYQQWTDTDRSTLETIMQDAKRRSFNR